MKIRGYDMDEKEWSISSRVYKGWKSDEIMEVNVGEGLCRDQDGPARFIATFKTEADAQHACDLHNATLDYAEPK